MTYIKAWKGFRRAFWKKLPGNRDWDSVLTVPFLPAAKQRARQNAHAVRKKIRVYERGSQFDLLRKCRATYMWVSPMPDELLDCYGLIQAECTDNDELYCDYLIYPAGAGLKKIQRLFVENLRSVREELF